MSELTINYLNMAIRVCIDYVKDRQIGGRIYHCLLEEPYFFSDLSDFILQVDRILDLQGFPHAFQKKRSFTKPDSEAADWEPKVYMEPAQMGKEEGKITTFLLKILSRQNTTWQGKIDWLSDSKEPDDFYSALEFIFLVDEYLSN